MFKIYKKGQGKYTRLITFLAVTFIAVIGAYILSDRLKQSFGGIEGYGAYLQFGIPVVVVAAVALGVFWLVNRQRSADFLIATEGEMKKVSWSSRAEIVGSTKVVIVTTFVMAAVLFGVDFMFQRVFQVIGIWRV